MNDGKNAPGADKETYSKRSKTFYIRLAIVYAVVLLLVILAINIESFETAINRIFAVTAPIFFGAIIAYLCNPLYVVFQDKVFKKVKSAKIRKTLSILLTYIVVFLVIFALLFLVAEQMITSVQAFIMNIDTYIANAEELIFGLIDNLGFIKSEAEMNGDASTGPPEVSGIPSGTENESSGTSDLPSEESTPTTEGITTDSPSTDVTTNVPSTDGSADSDKDKVNILDFSFTKEGIIEAIHNFLNNSGELFNQIGTAIVSSGTAAISFVFNLFLGFIFSVYMLAEKDQLIAQAKKLSYAFLKKEKADALCELGNYADEKVGHFIKGKLIESGIVGVMAYFAFLIFKIPSPLMIAVIVAIMNIIPVFGPFLGAIPAALIVLIIDPPKTIPYIIIVIIIMQINGNYISPKIVGNRTGLTPLGAIAALTLMSGYFGIIGMFLGIPICAILVESLWIQANRRLEAKNLATDVADYYPPNALIDTESDSKPHNFTSIVVDAVLGIFCKIFKINKDKKKDNNKDGTSDK